MRKLKLSNIYEKRWIVDDPVEFISSHIGDNDKSLFGLPGKIYDQIINYINSNKQPDKKYYKYLKQLNTIKENIVLYRGLRFAIEDGYQLARYNAFLSSEKEMNLSFIDVTSWTYDYSVAKAFAHSWGDEKGVGVVLKIVAKPKDVLLDIHNLPLNFQTYIKEREVILMPGSYTISIDNVYDGPIIDKYKKTINDLLSTRLKDLFEEEIEYQDMLKLLNVRYHYKEDAIIRTRFENFLNEKLINSGFMRSGRFIFIDSPHSDKFMELADYEYDIKNKNLQKPEIEIEFKYNLNNQIRNKASLEKLENVLKQIEKNGMEEFKVKIREKK